MKMQEAVNQFIINTVLINPIEKIISQLKNGYFRDCDIRWLDRKLEHFMLFASETLGVNSIKKTESELHSIMNEHCKQYYLRYFTGLLEYFKTL